MHRAHPFTSCLTYSICLSLLSRAVECVNVEQVFPCFVVRGAVTAYTEQPIADSTISSVATAVQAAVESEGLDLADNRILGVSWRDLETDPIPGDGNPTNTPTQAPAGNAPTPDQPTNGSPQGALDGGGDDPVLETWMIILIAVGGTLLLCAAYLCIRNRDAAPAYDDDVDDSPSESSDDVFDDEDVAKKERTSLVASSAAATPAARSSGFPPRPTPVIQEEEDNEPAPSLRPPSQTVASTSPFGERKPSVTSQQSAPGAAQIQSDASSEAASEFDDPLDEEEVSAIDEESFGDEPITEEDLRSTGNGSSGEGSAIFAPKAAPTAADNPLVSPFGTSPGPGDNNSQGRWDEEEFAQSAPPPMDSTSEEEFSSEYEEEAVDEEYEVEYVEEEDDTATFEDVEGDEEESYSDEWEEEEESDEEEEIVRDEPGGTPILPWLAQDDE